MNSATPTYREAKARLKTLPAAEQDAFLRRLITYKSEVDRAGAAWQVVSFVGMLGGIALVLLAGELSGPDWPLYVGSAASLGAGLWASRVAAEKKRAYERAHPFEG